MSNTQFPYSDNPREASGRFARKGCRCCGRLFGRDDEPRAGLWSPRFFCEPCDGQRVRRISRQLDSIVGGAGNLGERCDHSTVLTRAQVIADRENRTSTALPEGQDGR